MDKTEIKTAGDYWTAGQYWEAKSSEFMTIGESVIEHDDFIEAMNSFAEQESILFGNWLMNNYIQKWDGYIHRMGQISDEPKSAEQLYHSEEFKRFKESQAGA